MGFGVDREPEPEILDSAPEGHGAWRRGWAARLLRGWGTWLAGRGAPAPNGAMSWPGRGRSRLRQVPRWVVATTAMAVLAGGGAALALGHGRRTTTLTVTHRLQAIAGPVVLSSGCTELVNMSSREPPPGYRIEFGEVAVQPAVQRGQSIPEEQSTPRGWPYAYKTGFAFRGSGPPAMISVPAGWRKAVTLATPDGPDSSLYLPMCPLGAQWNTYVSVFYLRSPTACVPLQIRVGRYDTTVWFGLGRPCGR